MAPGLSNYVSDPSTERAVIAGYPKRPIRSLRARHLARQFFHVAPPTYADFFVEN